MAYWDLDTVQSRALLANTLVNLQSKKANGPIAEQNKNELLKGNPIIRRYLVYSHFGTIL